jgi:hypothetical protein
MRHTLPFVNRHGRIFSATANHKPRVSKIRFQAEARLVPVKIYRGIVFFAEFSGFGIGTGWGRPADNRRILPANNFDIPFKSEKRTGEDSSPSAKAG